MPEIIQPPKKKIVALYKEFPDDTKEFVAAFNIEQLPKYVVKSCLYGIGTSFAGRAKEFSIAHFPNIECLNQTLIKDNEPSTD